MSIVATTTTNNTIAIVITGVENPVQNDGQNSPVQRADVRIFAPNNPIGTDKPMRVKLIARIILRFRDNFMTGLRKLFFSLLILIA